MWQIRLNHSTAHAMPVLSLPPGRSEYLSERDLSTLAWGIREVRRIVATPPLRDQTTGELSPGRSIASGSKALMRWVRNS